jgi:hypothetical protein
MRRYILLLCFISLAVAASTRTDEIVQTCPKLAALDQTKWSGNKWLIGSSTERMFISSQFLQNYDLTPALANIRVLSDRLNQRGSQLILLPIPRAGMYFESILNKSNPLLNGFDFGAARASYQNMIQKAQNANVHAVSLDQVVAGTPDFFFNRDFHWTPNGAKAAANTVKVYLEKIPSFTNLSKSERTLTTEKTGEVRGYGGWVDDVCGVKIPYEKYPVWTAVDPKVGLLDAVEPQIAVLGDSYGFYKPGLDWGFEHFLSEATGLNVENASVPGGVTYASPIKYFSSKASEPLPKFIVWLFAFSVPPAWLFDEIIPAISMCLNPMALIADETRTRFVVPSGPGRFLRLLNFQTPVGVDLELKFGAVSKVFKRPASNDGSTVKNFFLALPTERSGAIMLNTPLTDDASFEVCEQ